MTHSEVFSWIKIQGASFAIVHFSGGNDEGFIDLIELQNADHVVVHELEEWHDDTQYWDCDKHCWESRRKMTLDEMANKALCKPVYDTYGSFAGEFYVSSTVVWDADKQTCKIGGRAC